MGDNNNQKREIIDLNFPYDSSSDNPFPYDPPSENLNHLETDTEFLDLTLPFLSHHRRSPSADSIYDLFDATIQPSTSADAFTSRGSPFPYIYTPQFPHIEVLPESTQSEDDIPAAVPVRRRPRRNRTDTPAAITPPYPWAGDRRGSVLSMTDLRSRSIFVVNGDVRCERCHETYEIGYNLEEKFDELCVFISENVEGMCHRAHINWMDPVFLNCGVCNEEKCVKPVISEKKRSINWLFLLLGQMLGFCSLNQLKYFCKHTMNHRTGGKDRILFIVYMKLCRQVDPDRAFYGNS